MGTEHNDQFHMGRLPIKPYSFINARNAIKADDGVTSQDEFAVCKEFLIDYLPTTDDSTKFYDNNNDVVLRENLVPGKKYKNMETGDIVTAYEDGAVIREATYDMYLVDPNDRKHFINLSQLIRTLAPIGDANNLTVTIEGKENAIDLRSIINYIYSRFIFPNPEFEDKDKILDIIDMIKNGDPKIISTVLTDVNNNIILPITSADNVYDKNGNSLQAKIDSITRVGFATSFVVTRESGNSFEFEYPFENYRKNGNHVEVRIGGTIVNKARYYFIDGDPSDKGDIPTRANIVFTDHAIEKGRTISFLFIYNAASNGSTYEIIDGSSIADGSLPSSKLDKVSDSFCYADPTSVATSKALYDLYVTLSQAIADSSMYAMFAEDTSSSASTITVTVPSNFNLQNGSSLSILTKCQKNAGCTISINGGTALPIHTSNGALSSKLSGSKIFKFYYSNGKMFLKSLSDYKISSNRWFKNLADKDTVVSYKGLNVIDEADIFVYRNGVRLFEGIDYKINRAAETITLFVPGEDQEKIVFETLDVIDY